MEFMGPTPLPPSPDTARQLGITFEQIRDSELGSGARMCLDVFVTAQNSSHSRVIHVWDALPKFSFSHTLNASELGILVDGQRNPTRNPRITLRVTITAAILESKKTGKNRVVFPGRREEIVERALRYLAVQRVIGFCPDRSPQTGSGVHATFTLYRLQQETIRTGHTHTLTHSFRKRWMCSAGASSPSGAFTARLFSYRPLSL